jgi:hypothetical protein
MPELRDVIDNGYNSDGDMQPSTEPESFVDRLHYLSDLIDELRVMAQAAELETLAGILSMAFLEANKQISTRRTLPR